MHCNVDGKQLAAAIERQKTDISRIFNVGFAGATLDSSEIFSTPTVPRDNRSQLLQIRKTKIKDIISSKTGHMQQHILSHLLKSNFILNQRNIRALPFITRSFLE